MDVWVVEALRVGYRIPFDRRPPLSERPLSLPAYSPQSIKGVALTQELQNFLRKGAVEPAPQSPGFYSHLFLVQKASGSWRPIIDLSTLNDYITSSRFHMETPRSVLSSIPPSDWMISLDLQDAYLQVPVHHDSLRGSREVVPVEGPLFRSYNRARSLHQAPLCNSCRVGLTIEHILTACPAFDSERRAASLHGRSMSEVLGNDCRIGGLMLFLRNTGFYHKF